MMPGEGIGPEMMGYVKQVYKEAAVPVDFEMVEFDQDRGNLLKGIDNKTVKA